jgi:hypothetical protein
LKFTIVIAPIRSRIRCIMVLPVLAAAAVLRYVPAHDELKYTFGGAAPVRHIQPGTRIVSWT